MNLDREQLDDWLEKGILGLFLAILVFGAMAFGGVRLSEFIVIQILTAAILGLWIVRLWINPDLRLLWPPILWVVLIFCGYAVLQYRTSDIEYVARQEALRVLVYSALFFMVVNNLNRQESTQIVLYTLIFTGMVIAIYAVYQYLTDSPKVWMLTKPLAYMKRGNGTFYCPNHLAGFLEMILPVGLAFVAAGRSSAAWKVVVLYASLVIGAGIVVSFSRGGWVSASCGVALFFFLMLRKPEFRIPVLAVMLVVLATAFVVVRDNVSIHRRAAVSLKDGQVEDVRLQLFGPAIEIWKQEPVWGTGPGSFDYRFPAYRPWDVQFRPERVHNDYLNALTDWGLVGFGLITAGLAFFGHTIWRMWKFSQRGGGLGSGLSNRLALVIGVSSGVAAILVHSLMDLNMHIPANAITCLTLIALLSASMRYATDRFWLKPGLLGRLTCTLVAGAAAWCLIVNSAHFARGQSAIKAAARLPEGSQSNIELLKKAAAIEPGNFELTYRIGELVRLQSFLGEPGYEKLATEALRWFGTTLQHNPHDAYAAAKIGMCLDWLGRRESAGRYFRMAHELDPNGYLLTAYVGWHYVQTGQYDVAKLWLTRSLYQHPNDFTRTYLKIVEARLAEAKAADTR